MVFLCYIWCKLLADAHIKFSISGVLVFVTWYRIMMNSIFGNLGLFLCCQNRIKLYDVVEAMFVRKYVQMLTHLVLVLTM